MGYINIDGVISFFADFRAGVLQGCPASGSLVVIAINPFLNLIETKLCAPREVCRAFADDLAAVLRSIEALKPISSLFKLLQAVSGMALKAKKCVIVPLGCSLSQELIDHIREWLKKRIPSWSSFSIAEEAKYLGFNLGPGVEDDGGVWVGPCAKWESRAGVLAKAKLAPAIGISEYNSRAVSTLSYVGQLFPFPESQLQKEKSLVQRIFHYVNNTSPKAFYFRGKEVGLPQATSAATMCEAARIRTILCTVKNWREYYDEYSEVTSTYGSIASLGDGPDSNTWCSKPIVAHMGEIAEKLSGEYKDIAAKAKQDRDSNKRLGMQASFHKLLLPVFFPVDFASEVFRRLRLWCPEPFKSEIRERHLETAIQILKKQKPGAITSVYKTWCNSWPTTNRSNVATANCIFGCEAPDTVEHYIFGCCCWSLLAKAQNSSDTVQGINRLALGCADAVSSIQSIHTLLDSYQFLCNRYERPTHIQIRQSFKESCRRASKYFRAPNRQRTHTQRNEQPGMSTDMKKKCRWSARASTSTNHSYRPNRHNQNPDTEHVSMLPDSPEADDLSGTDEERENM